MRKPASLETRRELRSAIAELYRTADRPGKKAILEEFVKVTGYHRKHVIRIMNGKQAAEQQKPVGERIHQVAVDEAPIVLWEAADRICGKRLKALLPTLVVAIERHGHLRLDETIRERLLSLSAATIDRRLQQVRAHAFGARRKKNALSRVRKLVAVKTFAD